MLLKLSHATEITMWYFCCRCLDVCGCVKVTDHGVRALARSCNRLNYLDLSSTSITQKRYSNVFRLKYITSLLIGCRECMLHSSMKHGGIPSDQSETFQCNAFFSIIWARVVCYKSQNSLTYSAESWMHFGSYKSTKKNP